MLGCGKGKACKIMKELETIGLIERERRGLCKPDLIYVKKFTDQTENPERPHKELDLEQANIMGIPITMMNTKNSSDTASRS